MSVLSWLVAAFLGAAIALALDHHRDRRPPASAWACAAAADAATVVRESWEHIWVGAALTAVLAVYMGAKAVQRRGAR